MCYDHINMGKNRNQHTCIVEGCNKPSRNKTKPGLCNACYIREYRKINKKGKQVITLAMEGKFRRTNGQRIPVGEIQSIIDGYKKHNMSPRDIMRIYEIDRKTLLKIISTK